jgi:hypothetical protein
MLLGDVPIKPVGVWFSRCSASYKRQLVCGSIPGTRGRLVPNRAARCQRTGESTQTAAGISHRHISAAERPTHEAPHTSLPITQCKPIHPSSPAFVMHTMKPSKPTDDTDRDTFQLQIIRCMRLCTRQCTSQLYTYCFMVHFSFHGLHALRRPHHTRRHSTHTAADNSVHETLHTTMHVATVHLFLYGTLLLSWALCTLRRPHHTRRHSTHKQASSTYGSSQRDS